MTRIRGLLAIVALLALCTPVAAQPVGSPQTITVIDSGTACVTAPTACATFALDSSTGSLTLGVTGTWTGTLTFEGTNNGGVWTSVVAVNLATGAQATTTTASGLFSVTNAGVIAIRARATAAVTGTAIITAARGIGFTRLFGPSPTFTTVLLGDGLVTAPSWAYASQPTMGFYRPAADKLMFADASQATMGFINGTGFVMDSLRQIVWTGTAGDALATTDTALSRVSPGTVRVSHQTATSTAEWQVSGGNGGFISSVKALTELTTIAAAATTNTAIQIPANAVVLGVSVRVVTVIPTAATFTVTSATPSKTWNTAAVTVAANSTDPGTAPGPSFQTTASAITITPNLTPGAATGQVRVTIFYYTITPPSS